MPTTSNSKTVGDGDGDIQIIITQVSQSPVNNTSQVNVKGWIHNNATGTVSHTANDINGFIRGEASWVSTFGFSIPAGGAFKFIDHTFTVDHNSDGTKSVNFTVGYTDTHTLTFGAGWTISATLVLDKIVQPPAAPTITGFTGGTSTQVTVNWVPAFFLTDGPTAYRVVVQQFTTLAVQPAPVTYNVGNVVLLTVTGLAPGSSYIFQVFAKNASLINGGWSKGSAEAIYGPLPKIHIRIGGVWRDATPYIRDGGSWRLAIPFIRVFDPASFVPNTHGWKQCN
jgi:hypothetical protein